jgi:hypothetical protein
MKNLKNPPRASLLLAAALAVSLLAGPALARSEEADKGNAPAGSAASETTGSVEPDSKVEEQKRLDDCMAAWDKKTHMTKQQWRRTCKNLLDEKL